MKLDALSLLPNTTLGAVAATPFITGGLAVAGAAQSAPLAVGLAPFTAGTSLVVVPTLAAGASAGLGLFLSASLVAANLIFRK